MLRFVVIYRPPNSSLTNFFADFSEYYETLILKSGHLIITGDFNIHVDILSDPVVEEFKDPLQSFGLSQHVISPTHRQGHTLDLVITQIDDTLSLERLYVKDSCLSDHNAVHFFLPHDNRPLSAKPVSIQYRKYKSINYSIFTEDVKNSRLFKHDLLSTSELVDLYDEEITSIIQKHAPLVVRKINTNQKKPWFNDKYEMRAKQDERQKGDGGRHNL
ncbi:hypothetical protein SNE40_018244 [Patella caerulea]|uniref:Endonuclease/exonuclease/phosphatase domain-containing protein n=1 Tax=Patella caerulea TaxID=87958 RepID=A0AAN8J7Z7_PATCE